MKKSIFFVLALVMSICLPLTLMADNDQVITFDRLPATAQAMLKQNFADKVPLVITADWDDYKVMYTPTATRWNSIRKATGVTSNARPARFLPPSFPHRS